MIRTLVAAALAAFPAAVLAVTVPAPPPATFTPQAFRAHVAFLADDLLEGRDIGSRGHEIAARYVAERFEAMGLKPAGDPDGKGGTRWLQRIPFQRTGPMRETSMVAVHHAGATQVFRHGIDANILPNAAFPSGTIDAPLVFVGYGVDAPAQGLDDFAGLDVRGKIVVELAGMPAGVPSEIAAHLSDTKRAMAARRGAIGLLRIETRESAALHPFARSLQYAQTPTYAWVGSDGTPQVEGGAVRAYAAVDGKAAEAMFAGAPKPLAAVLAEAATKGTKPRGFALATSATIVQDAAVARITSPNVVGILPGRDPALAAQYVVLSAHLDHLGVKPPAAGDTPQTDRIYNGALDNASGVATMLEVARAMAGARTPPRRSVVFLASTGEEKGLLGADYYATHPTVPAKAIVGNVDLDMPLLLYPFSDVIAFGAEHSTLGPLVAAAIKPMGLTLEPDPMPEETIFVRSDHYRFVRQGVPAVFLATGFANGGAAAWKAFLAGNYHHPGDDMSQAIDWTSGARFAEANYRITEAMADAPAAPAWNRGDFFGDLYAPAATKAAPGR